MIKRLGTAGGAGGWGQPRGDSGYPAERQPRCRRSALDHPSATWASSIVAVLADMAGGKKA